MGKGRYNLLLENHYSRITSVKGDNIKLSANYIWWLWNFPSEIDGSEISQIDGCGISLVKLHEKSNIHEKNCPRDQRTLICSNGLAQLNPSDSGVAFSPEEQVIGAEIYQCLQVVSSNYSFSSTEADNSRFKMMLPDSRIAAIYSQGKTKVRYNIQFGIAPYIKQMLLYDVNNTPYTFRFDESTSSQIKKQYDGYLQYWSTKYDEVINCYCGSLFVGHCTQEQLIEHYEFTKNLKLDSSFYCILLEWMDHVLLMHFSRNFLMSCVKRKVLVFWTWELGVFTKFIMHTKQWWKNWNLTLISLLLAFILFSNF